MRRIFIFREGNMMGALAGPDMVRGVAGFGVTIGDALRDLADQFQEHGYRLNPPAVVNVAGTTVQATGFTTTSSLAREQVTTLIDNIKHKRSILRITGGIITVQVDDSVWKDVV
jgi:hypothetical protein